MQDILTYLQPHYQITRPGEITWAHAVNSLERLETALGDPQLMILEVDISRSLNGEIIAAHPPRFSSDLSFAHLLDRVAPTYKTLKLDFKDPRTVEPCLRQLRASNLQKPILLNADVLQGNGARPPRFEAAEFLDLCARLYPEGILSPGWTTHGNPAQAYFTGANIDEMLDLCQRSMLRQVTFPTRAAYLPRCWQDVSRLLRQDGYTLTIWSGEPLTRELKTWLHQHTNPTVTSYDCYDEQGQQFRM